jgi:integrase
MEWPHIDPVRRIWRQPKSKNGLSHEVMLSAQASAIIEARRGLHEIYVFPLPNGSGHVDSKAIGIQQWAARSDLAIEAWTVHDLRRSALTGLARLGCSRQIQNRIANHSDSSIAAIYDKHSYDAEARIWLQQWADAIDELQKKEDRGHSVKRITRKRSEAVT